MLIVALVLAVIGLAALVTAVATSNELIAWVCIAASVVGVILLIVDAVRERSRGQRAAGADEREVGKEPAEHDEAEHFDADYPEDGHREGETETSVVEQADDEDRVSDEDRNR
jgi:hypothetical protein